MNTTKYSLDLPFSGQQFLIENKKESDLIVSLAGNPNVGKSTVFNELTGLNQHTGNWPGKTVSNAQGYFSFQDKGVHLVDVPGCYSMLSHSPEEEYARDFICFGKSDKTVIVCDATCLERSLSLVLQIAEITPGCIVCVNLMDEAKKRHIEIDTQKLSDMLNLPVIPTAARNKKGLGRLKEEMINENKSDWTNITYPDYIEEAIRILSPDLSGYCKENGLNCRWLSLRLLEEYDQTIEILSKYIGKVPSINEAVQSAKNYLALCLISEHQFSDDIAKSFVKKAEAIAKQCVLCENKENDKDRKIDRIVTGKWTAFPLIALLLTLLFWITITGANIPSDLLSKGLFYLEEKMFDFSVNIGLPPTLCELIFHGVYRVLAWVVSVMLPPMAIFFPLFTLMEDVGFLPRIAFNLDRAFSGCNACGKQSLTMCMGFGCNAAGVVGCRIIDSPRERLIAMLTNVFVPCNGRFPILIGIISMFFLNGLGSGFGSVFSALLLALLIVFGFLITLLSSYLLSKTVLRGVPSSFTLELPSYRRPQIVKVLVRSLLDRTLFVLGRSVAVAAPAGLIIWLCANVQIGGISVLKYLTDFFEPFGSFFGLDGVIIVAFLLGFPANEIVLPIMLMAYTATGTLSDVTSLSMLKEVFLENGWTLLTATNVLIFTLMHFPCSTTLLTIRKESGKWKWTLLSFLLPTLFGLLFCFLNRLLFSLF